MKRSASCAKQAAKQDLYFVAKALVVLRMRSTTSLFNEQPHVFHTLNSQFGYHAIEFILMEDTNVFESGSLFHGHPGTDHFVASQFEARNDSSSRPRQCCHRCRWRAPTTATTCVGLQKQLSSAACRRRASTTATLALKRFANQLTVKRGKAFEAFLLPCYDFRQFTKDEAVRTIFVACMCGT
jgi:hypothetical protein